MRFKPPPEYVGGTNNRLQRALDDDFEQSATRSETSAKTRQEKALAALQQRRKCRGSAALVAESRLAGSSRGAKKFHEAAL